MICERNRRLAPEKERVQERLDGLWNDDHLPEVALAGRHFAVISDFHMGNGGRADDFHKNEEAMLRALRFYNEGGFTLILLGDIEELWQFNLHEIANRYDDTIYTAFRNFPAGRLYRVYGNHDIDWRIPLDPARAAGRRADSPVEGLKLVDAQSGRRFLLVHGHQGTADSDSFAELNRPFVRAYRHLEPYVKVDRQESAPRSAITKAFDSHRYQWAKSRGAILICGHSHNAVFASRGWVSRLRERHDHLVRRIQSEADKGKRKGLLQEATEIQTELRRELARGRGIGSISKRPLPCYFNTGCAIYRNGITAIEIQDERIRLRKWHRRLAAGLSSELYHDGDLRAFINQLDN